jgi:hypothetical protein
LRTETTINNTYDFGIGKRLHNLPKLREIGFAANRRLIEIERMSHDCILSEDTFQAINPGDAADPVSLSPGWSPPPPPPCGASSRIGTLGHEKRGLYLARRN